MDKKKLGKLWEEIGTLDELEVMQVLSRLYDVYETLLQNDPDNAEALKFFNHLGQVISQTLECNLNRR